MPEEDLELWSATPGVPSDVIGGTAVREVALSECRLFRDAVGGAVLSIARRSTVQWMSCRRREPTKILSIKLLNVLALVFSSGNAKGEVSVTNYPVNVMTLWAKLESMEQEHRFNGAAYPVGMVRFPFRLKGQGFFPGGDGLWRDEAGISEPSNGNVARGGVVFLGNDFGTLASYTKLQSNGYENVPTWRHIKRRVLAAHLPLEALFFTNTIMGLREEGTALTKQSWKRMPQFAEFCGEFLRFQLQTIKPSLLVVMGPDARKSFDAFGKSSFSGEVLYTTHPYADFSFSTERLAADVVTLRNAWDAAQE